MNQKEKIEYWNKFFSSNPNKKMQDIVEEDAKRYRERWKKLYYVPKK